MNQNQENKELQGIAPKLFSIKEKRQPGAPDGYFDTLPEIIQDRIASETAIKKPFFGFLQRQKWSIVVSSVVLICGLWFFAPTNTSSPSLSAELTNSEFFDDVFDEDFDMDLPFEAPLALNSQLSLEESSSIEDYFLEEAYNDFDFEL